MAAPAASRKKAVKASDTAEKPARGRKPRAQSDVAEALQSAALDLFAEQNYSTVTIKDIAAATGINSALIYYYFGSKEDLFLKVVENTVETAFRKFDDVTSDVQSPEEIIASWIETHVLHFTLMQKLGKVSLDYASTRNRTPRIDRAVRSFYEKEAVVLRRAIEMGIEQKRFRAVDPERMSIFISTFLDGCLFRSVLFPRFSHKRAMEDMRSFVLAHLKGS
ncbi:TetR/AcrR family transcriptional regulator [Acidisoma silvae]|uniref:TetR/AcrR family transcriptional regulator n=1 Tax=Acidisoma silvae TaxID=2802396 RepID=A0A964DXT6_9PROT|nr:TetR/AcrR family transcriptional regulator [Acidisoma silvae]MCB8874620.1 TetR/AcrR family transcriptional regulator [Acidisoma silvae]